MITSFYEGKMPIVAVCDTRKDKTAPVAVIPDGDRGMMIRLCTSASQALTSHICLIIDDGIDNSGFSILEDIRRVSDKPVIMVSDRIGEMYTVMALSKGADCCIDRSTAGVIETEARIFSLLRRTFLTDDCEENARLLTNGVISVDTKRRTVIANGSKVRLTAIEYGILEHLLTNCGDVCPIDDIYRSVWHETPFSVKKTVVEHIRRIRSKVEPDPHNPCYIKAVFGVGYKMEYVRGA